MALETNLNQSPFFDDFDETKNFNRVLFRPGFAVQARELTQLQTILQNQIERFGNEILIDGTIVTGAALKIENIDFVKLRDKGAKKSVGQAKNCEDVNCAFAFFLKKLNCTALKMRSSALLINSLKCDTKVVSVFSE